MRKALARSLVLLLVPVLLVSCETVSYYGQAARGQLSLLHGREDIEQLLADSSLDAQTRAKLQQVQQALDFAEHSLQLPSGGSYRSFTALDRPYVVWNVFAASEFSVEPTQWCYPIAGCVSYRGYFSEQAAQRYAERLRAQGLEVYSGGVDAYSTLGWFNDPLTSAVLRRPDHRLVALLFHELAHQRLYVPGDTEFNESFASFVEQEGLRRWLAQQGQSDAPLLAQIARENQLQQEFVQLVSAHREALRTLYGSDVPQTQMREGKQALQEQLRLDYQRWRATTSYTGYDRWFEGPLNNAQLATVASYNALVPFFADLLAQKQGDLPAFYAEVAALAELPAQERAQRLGR